ncbi:MAG: response regulator [Rhodothermia bacterium]|nr:response regulator [Rhodothermia bacterium]
MSAQEYTVCLVDPDEAVHDALSTLLRASGTQVRCFAAAEDFLKSGVVLDADTSCVLAEASLPGMGCLAFLKRLRAIGADLPIIVLTSTSDRGIAAQALKAGALEVIEKPLVSDRILERLFPTACGCEASQPDEFFKPAAKGGCNCRIWQDN